MQSSIVVCGLVVVCLYVHSFRLGLNGMSPSIQHRTSCMVKLSMKHTTIFKYSETNKTGLNYQET